MFGAVPLRTLERIAAFCMLSGFVLGVTADHVLGRMALDAALLPKFFKSASLPASSLKELAGGRDEEATATARRAVLKQPLSVEALAALAQSSAVLEPEMSSSALSQAAGLGWRNIVVQNAALRSAANEGQWEVVGRIVDAAARLRSLDKVDKEIFEHHDPSIYARMMAPAFIYSPASWFAFARWLRENDLRIQSAEVIQNSPYYAEESGCVRLGMALDDLIKFGQIEAAAKIIEGRCNAFLTSPSSGLRFGQQFGNIRRGPFEWKLAGNSGVNFKMNDVSGDFYLIIENKDPIARRFASKILHKKYLESDLMIFMRKYGDRSSKIRPITLSKQCISGDCDFLSVSFEIPQGMYQVWAE